MKKIVLGMVCVGVLTFARAATTDAVWNYASTGTTITNAADWFNAGNWSGGTVADSAAYSAVLTNAVGPRYIKINTPLTLGGISGTWSGTNVSVIVSDHPLTIDNAGVTYHFGLGCFFTDITTPNSTGPLNSGLYCGTISAPTRITLAGGDSYHRLDWYAKSSDPVRTNDIVTPLLYRGSAGWRVCGPKGSAAVEGTWRVTAGSPYVFRTGAAHTIAAGTTVTSGDVFPAGTFVKRVFSDSSIELSAAASAETESGEKTLSFAAFTPHTVYQLDELRMVAYGNSRMSFMKHAEEDDFRVEVKSLTAAGTAFHYMFWPDVSDVSMKPARTVIHNADGTFAPHLNMALGTCHLEFAETGTQGAVSGLPRSHVCFNSLSPSATARFTVTNNISAVIGNFTNWTGTVTKDGAGTLTIAATNLLAKNTGSLVVREGTLALAAGSWVKSVAVSNGATLKIDGALAPDQVILAPGATVEGPGTLAVPSVGLISGVRFTNGAFVRLPHAGEVFYEPPATNVVGTPAFWVDASRADTITFKDGDGVTVSRIDDVRGAAYGFATNAVNCPTLVKDESGNPHHIKFTRFVNGSMDISSCDDLVWDKVITNIRTVFLVQDTTDGGGQFLGKTDRISGTGDYMRPAENGSIYTRPIVHTDAGRQKVWGGVFYINGDRWNTADGYPYRGGGNSRFRDDGVSAVWWTPHVDSAHPTGDTAADAFSFNSSATGRSGFHRVCECIVYTNTVTEAERLAITGHLMKKWLNCEVNYRRAFGTNSVLAALDTGSLPGIEVAAGETAYVGEIADGQDFVKSGGGMLCVDDYANPNGSLRVSGGVLSLKSDAVTLGDIPEGAYFHVDASKPDSFTTNILPSGATRISKWKDRRGDGYPYAYVRNGASTNYATLKMDALNGKPAVDFGPHLSSPTFSWADISYTPALEFASCAYLHSAFLVYGSAKGGGSIIGSTQSGTHGPYGGYGIHRIPGGGGDWRTPMVTNYYASAFYNLFLPGGMRTKLNGNDVNAAQTGLSGSWDLISLVSYETFGSGGFSSNNYNKDVGGQEIGEAIFYRTGLSRESATKVEAYLAKKWFNRETPGFRAAAASNLTVEAGATLTLVGNQPITVKSFSGGGTVSGSVALAANAVLEVTVKPDGSVDTLTVTGSLDLSNGGAVRLVGEVANLAIGRHVLVRCDSITAAEAGNWTIQAPALSDKLAFHAKIVDGEFVLDVYALGTMMLLR